MRNGTSAVRSQAARLYNLYFAFRSKSNSVFSEDNLQIISDMESIVAGHVAYPKYCLLNYGDSGNAFGCVDKYSLVDLLRSNTNSSVTLQTTLNQLYSKPFEYGYFFSKNYNVTNGSGEYTRSILYTGLPLDGYLNKDDRTYEQGEAVVENYLMKVSDKLHDYLGTKRGFFSSKYMDEKGRIKDDLEVFWWSFGLQQAVFSEAAMADFLWAVFSVFSVGIYMGLHTRSFFMAVVGMMEIVFTIFLAFFFYRVIFQITYFTSIHFLAAFLLLGIGADDVFVFVDAFKQSLCHPDASVNLEKRLEYTSLRASKAVMITSLTTTVAFLATASSRVMPISTFGIYAALCIFLLYWINVIIMPPALICWERMRTKCKTQDENGNAEDRDKTEMGESNASLVVEKLRSIEKYFNGAHTNFIKEFKYCIFTLFVGITICGIYFCTTLETPDEQEDYFPKSHMFTQYRELIRSGKSSPFLSSGRDYVAEVQVAWGLKGMDLSGTSPWNPDAMGKVIYDEEFDMSSPEAQQHVYDVCQNAKSAPCSAKGCINGKLIRNGEAKCFIEEFKTWLEAKNQAFPLPREEFMPQLQIFAALPSSLQNFRNQIGLFPKLEDEHAHKLRFVTFSFNTTFSPPRPQLYTKAVYDNWQDFVKVQNADAPSGVKNMFQSTNFAWMWLKTQQALVMGVELGVTLVIVIAFIVINISTMNVIVSAGAIFTIGGIVTTTMGIGVAAIMGYPLGVAESVATVILIGFSMDYCLHLAGAYVASRKLCREDKTQDSLTEMGVSVTAGALTTIFSAVFLFGKYILLLEHSSYFVAEMCYCFLGCIITFFQKFAFIIVFTIAGSWLWSTLFFTSFCMVSFLPIFFSCLMTLMV